MDAGTIIALIVGVLGVAITIVIWLAATRAVNVQKSQEDPDAYFRTVGQDAWASAKRIYDGTIEQLENEVQRQGRQIADQNDEIIRLNREIVRIRNRRAGEDSGPQPAIRDT
jgi:hypothetical protein